MISINSYQLILNACKCDVYSDSYIVPLRMCNTESCPISHCLLKFIGKYCVRIDLFRHRIWLMLLIIIRINRLLLIFQRVFPFNRFKSHQEPMFRFELSFISTNWIPISVFVSVTTVGVEAVLGRSTSLPCDIEPDARDDRVYMVLWFREKAGKPLYK